MTVAQISGQVHGTYLNVIPPPESKLCFKISTNRSVEAKLNNFSRVEPVLTSLQIPFDVNTARGVMTENHGTAMKLLYQLFVTLNKKDKSGESSAVVEQARRQTQVTHSRLL